MFHLTKRFFLRWKYWVIISIPMLLSPILIVTYSTPFGGWNGLMAFPLLSMGKIALRYEQIDIRARLRNELNSYLKEARSAFLMLLVMFYWVFDVMPLAVTALLPVALLPLFGIMSSVDTSPAYMKDINMLLTAGVATALGIEYCNLHKRIALKILMVLGTTPRWLFMGFMLPSVFLSMWINNTSTTAMMVPIADSVLDEMFPDENMDERDVPDDETKEKNRNAKQMRNGSMLSIAYGSNIGGTGTLNGTVANLVFIGIINTEYPTLKVNYLNWMFFSIPNMVLCVISVWIILQICTLGFKTTFTWKKNDLESKENIQFMLQKKYKDLGPLTFHEKAILALFIILVLLWIFREPGFIPGWRKFCYSDVKVSDSAAAVFVLVLMFALPATEDWWWSDIRDRTLDPPPPRCLIWEVVHARMTWGVVFILGGGFALADACKVSGLSAWIGQSMLVFEGIPPFLLCLVFMMVTVSLTTVTSNTSAATILLPIMVTISDSMNVSPLFLLIPTTLSCSYAFIFPISTPPNAIVYERSNMNMLTMVYAGSLSAVVCVTVTIILMFTLEPLIFSTEIVHTTKESIN